MTYLYLGILLFGGAHVLSILLPGLRDSIKRAIGEGTFKGLYALVSFAGLISLGYAYWLGRSGPATLDTLYEPWEGGRHLTMLLAWVAFVLLAASHGKGHIKKWLKHPMSIGIALWSTGHLLSNGERAVVYIFGMLLVIALLDLVLSFARGKQPTHEPRIRSDIIALIAGTVLYLVLLFGFHPYVLNIPVAG